MGNKQHYFEATSDSYCSTCKGTCWVEGNNAQTQKNAREMFGITPNRCVNGEIDVLCPYSDSPKYMY